jgi:sugar phosphate isomerase/epimerase
VPIRQYFPKGSLQPAFRDHRLVPASSVATGEASGKHRIRQQRSSPVPSSPSVQLYTVRDAIAEDLQGAVARVAEIGFTKVEPYAFVERAEEFEKAFAASGVTAPSGHAPVIDSDDPQRTFDAANRLGIGTVIDPFIPTDRWQTADDAYRLADRVNELQALAARSGLGFGYHNHNWEFSNRVDGRPVYEFFLERLSAAVVLEVDTFWSTVGGADTPALLTGLGERVQFLHIKDGKVAGDIATSLPSSESALDVPDALRVAFENQTPAGQGDVDVKAVLTAAPHALRVVEFDGYKGDVFEGIAESLAWLAENDR